MPKFDKTRPFAAVFGDHGGARVFQDGHYFNGAGEHLPALDPKPAAKAEFDKFDHDKDGRPGGSLPKSERKAKPEEDDETAPAPKMGDPEVQDIDLKAWARGEVKVPWHILADAVQAKYSERPRNGDHARQIIMAE